MLDLNETLTPPHSDASVQRNGTAPSESLEKLVTSIGDLCGGAEIDLSRLDGSSGLDRMPPGELDVVEQTLAKNLLGDDSSKSVIFTGGLGRFRVIDKEFADLCRTERLEEWLSPENRAMREEPRTAVSPSLANCAIVSGIGNPHFADTIAARLGLPLTTVSSTTFANSELKPILDASVRGKDVFLVQRFPAPVNEYVVGHQLIIDALHRASAKSVTLVAPYFPYCRGDKRGEDRTSVSSAVIAEMWGQNSDGLLTVDIHAQQIEALFKRGFHNFSGHALLLRKIHEHYGDQRLVAVFPDEGGAKRSEEDHLPEKLVDIFGPDIIFAHASKRRSGPNTTGKSTLMVEDPSKLVGRIAIMFDDMLDTGGTAIKSAENLKRAGVTEVVLAMTHPVASRAAFEKAQRAMVEVGGKMVRTIDRIFVTDSLPFATRKNGFIEVIGLGELYAHAILRLCQGHGASLRELSDVFSGRQDVPPITSFTRDLMH